MVISDFDFVSIAVTPDKADAPLIVDANAELALAVAAECFQTIAWRRRQITKFDSNVQLAQLALQNTFNITKPFDVLPRV
jgi:hypothetical protein